MRDHHVKKAGTAMKSLLGSAMGIAVVFLAGTAEAQQGMPNTRTMTCAAVQALVAQKGAIVLATSATTYDRYVSNVRYCAGAEQVKPEWVPTLDGACYVGGGTCWDPSTFYGNR